MKRILIAVAVVALTLFAAKLYAAEATATKMVTPDWHYRWYEGRWWYWMPESRQWLVWSGSAWVPSENASTCGGTQTVSRTTSEATNDAKLRAQGGTYEPAYSHGGYESGASSGTVGSYAGYGWTWGPGTAFRDSPGRRF